jgi:predicted MFS family arabinose efflux permease
MSRPLALVFISSFGALTSFYLLLSVVPMYATSLGVGGAGAGLVTGVLMLATVVGELAVPRVVARYGDGPVFAAGLVMLGLPALALMGGGGLALVLAVCVVRGLGFATTVVVGGVFVASLVPRERRGEGLGLFGLVAGVPAVVALPAGVWLVGPVGYTPVFISSALVALAGVAAVWGISVDEPTPERPVGLLAGLRNPMLTGPSVLFAATTVAAGVVVAFLPLAVTTASGNVAAIGLLVQAVASTATRWWAGRYGDRHGSDRLLVPGLLAAAVGMLALVVTASPVAVVAGMVTFGAGFGVTQNASMAVMLDRVTPAGYSTVSAIWNLAYDAGLGFGAAGFGVLSNQTGYPAGFAITAALMLVALAPATRSSRTAHHRARYACPIIREA